VVGGEKRTLRSRARVDLQKLYLGPKRQGKRKPQIAMEGGSTVSRNQSKKELGKTDPQKKKSCFDLKKRKKARGQGLTRPKKPRKSFINQGRTGKKGMEPKERKKIIKLCKKTNDGQPEPALSQKKAGAAGKGKSTSLLSPGKRRTPRSRLGGGKSSRCLQKNGWGGGVTQRTGPAHKSTNQLPQTPKGEGLLGKVSPGDKGSLLAATEEKKDPDTKPREVTNKRAPRSGSGPGCFAVGKRVNAAKP